MRRTWLCIQYVIALRVENEFWTTQLSTSIPVCIEARFGSDGLDHEAYLYVNVTGGTQEGGLTCSINNIKTVLVSLLVALKIPEKDYIYYPITPVEEWGLTMYLCFYRLLACLI